MRLGLKRKIRRYSGSNTMVPTHKTLDSIPSIKPTNQPNKNNPNPSLARTFSEVILDLDSLLHLLNRVLLSPIAPPPPPHNEFTGPIKKDTPGQDCGWCFLISIVYLFSLYISRSRHYLQYMSIEILQSFVM